MCKLEKNCFFMFLYLVATARLPPQITGTPFQSAATDPTILTGYLDTSRHVLIPEDKSTMEKSSDLLDNPSPTKRAPT